MEGKKIIYGLGAVLITAGIATGIYFIAKKPKEETSPLLPSDDKPKDAPQSEQKGGSGNNPSGCSPLNYSSPISKDSIPSTIANKSGSKYSLGQNVIVKSGQKVFRVDANGCGVGVTTTNQRKALGIIWHINPAGVNVIIKAKAGFAYPFYKANIENFE
jgi:hypothetical protein